MSKFAVFLNGPIGSGKTSLGRALAEHNKAAFIDGDDLSDPERPWYCSALQTSKNIVRASQIKLERSDLVVIAYPLNCINWIYFRRKFSESGVRTVFVSLNVPYETITGKLRNRDFSSHEHSRIQTMITEGYGKRPFSDIIFDNDGYDFKAALAKLDKAVRRAIQD